MTLFLTSKIVNNWPGTPAPVRESVTVHQFDIHLCNPFKTKSVVFNNMLVFHRLMQRAGLTVRSTGKMRTPGHDHWNCEPKAVHKVIFKNKNVHVSWKTV